MRTLQELPDFEFGVGFALAFDAGENKFKEEEHPRAANGQFGSGGGGAAAKSKPEKKAESSETKQSKGKKTVKVASKEKQQAGVDGIAGFLEMTGGYQKAQYARKGMQALNTFVLENGYPYEVNEKSFEGKRAPMHQCFSNATKKVLNNPDLTYVEGFISVHGVPLHHAWTVDKSGQVFDPTVEGADYIDGYYGIPFSRDYLLRTTLKNGVYGLLGHENPQSLQKLLSGQDKDFKQPVDLASISPEVVQQRLSFAERASRAIPSTEHIDTPERKALRKKVADDLYNKNIGERQHGREVTIVLGLPASGKSTLANPIIKEKGALES